MLLVVDVGNTHTVLGIYEGDALVHDFRIESSHQRTLDEYHVLIRALLSIAELDREEVEAAIVASVVPPVTEVLQRAIGLAFGFEPLIVGPGMKTGVRVRVEDPREVGADRIANAVAAHHLAGGAVVVVDFGTATTFDVISDSGEYLGGVIAPGIRIAADALFRRAAKLPAIEIAPPPRVVGRNTVHSMQSGVLFGYGSLIDGMIERIRAELGYDFAVLATGGLARTVREVSERIERVEDNLTLEGLRLLYERNR